jgi:hypothetical protein
MKLTIPLPCLSDDTRAKERPGTSVTSDTVAALPTLCAPSSHLVADLHGYGLPVYFHRRQKFYVRRDGNPSPVRVLIGWLLGKRAGLSTWQH